MRYDHLASCTNGACRSVTGLHMHALAVGIAAASAARTHACLMLLMPPAFDKVGPAHQRRATNSSVPEWQHQKDKSHRWTAQ